MDVVEWAEKESVTGMLKGGRGSCASDVNVIWSPPVMLCRYTCRESPTERRVQELRDDTQ